jgi:UDP-3-O-[3-hydroxymyristoyl] glucosamine N-acyltransferase
MRNYEKENSKLRKECLQIATIINQHMSITIQQIESILGSEAKIFNRQAAPVIENVKPIHLANEKSLVWIAKDKQNKAELVKETLAAIIVSDFEFAEQHEAFQDKCLIAVENPKLTFIRIVDKFFATKPPYGIHPTAFVSPKAKLHPNVYIGPFCYVGECEIGEGSYLFGHNHLYDGVRIGKNVTVHAGTVMGADGFGYQRNELNEFEKFPHIGGIVIEDNVEIGSNTCIDRGTLDDTIVKEGAKIDNLVHIAHNVIVGKHAAVIAHAMIGGSTDLGDYSWIAPSAALRDRIAVGKNSTVGLGAVLTKNVPDGETWLGNPAKEISEFLKKK